MHFVNRGHSSSPFSKKALIPNFLILQSGEAFLTMFDNVYRFHIFFSSVHGFFRTFSFSPSTFFFCHFHRNSFFSCSLQRKQTRMNEFRIFSCLCNFMIPRQCFHFVSLVVVRVSTPGLVLMLLFFMVAVVSIFCL